MNNKYHLNKELRGIIEEKLDEGMSFTQISKVIHKSRTTISREITKHSFNKPSNNKAAFKCIHKLECKKFNCSIFKECYEEEKCPILHKPPFVCNGCKRKAACQLTKKYYRAKIAQDEYEKTLSESRLGINLTKDKVYEVNSLLNDLIKDKNQSINHVFLNNKNIINFSKKSLYNYINLGVFEVRNIDLQRKVKYKPRKENEKSRTRIDIAVRKERTYEDFLNYITMHPEASIVEMDTVIGFSGGKVLLTLLFRKTKLMLIYLLDNKTKNCVTKQFELIKEKLGNDLYKKLFEVVLTDNGSEFFNPFGIELDNKTGEVLSHLFYCDPGKSYQKGTIEKNHEFIRYILPKGTSFNSLTQEKCDLIMNHINNTKRESLENNSPYELSKLLFPNDFLDSFNLVKIEDNDINLSPKLIK